MGPFPYLTASFDPLVLHAVLYFIIICESTYAVCFKFGKYESWTESFRQLRWMISYLTLFSSLLILSLTMSAIFSMPHYKGPFVQMLIASSLKQFLFACFYGCSTVDHFYNYSISRSMHCSHLRAILY